ncbi:MAG: methylmalonyl-CoA epimerase [Euryarchaeota archaeon]|jgi:methylmalonyl-CoA/ethylmalonyl-CoA epimerase|nr:methylmalonyl-CoA epimerase [Euryarchaeota archaeon]DAC62094.1 MAG TPA: methylmalonyl-CoA epimerase [Candidatus Poseidoniales archaeon]HII13024.1 methylmalonyl-CoA epimerase [Candidatus Thalassarchaeaceae archaeon]MBT4180735.1 methylmalonyl-CoA epimerase [Euryarchaeota archaeon]MBT4475282.1 methylmalonyl-CoA epimerase [Euryarchaeota archaeon]
MSRIDHIGIATEDIEQASKFWKLIGMKPGDDEINLEQDVKIRMFYGNNENGENTHSKVELIEALSENSPIAKFISKRGEGIQQLAISVVDIDELIKNLIEKGVRMINKKSMEGAGGHKIAFVHPESTGGVLVELVQRVDI